MNARLLCNIHDVIVKNDEIHPIFITKEMIKWMKNNNISRRPYHTAINCAFFQEILLGSKDSCACDDNKCNPANRN